MTYQKLTKVQQAKIIQDKVSALETEHFRLTLELQIEEAKQTTTGQSNPRIAELVAKIKDADIALSTLGKL